MLKKNLHDLLYFRDSKFLLRIASHNSGELCLADKLHIGYDRPYDCLTCPVVSQQMTQFCFAKLYFRQKRLFKTVKT